jgi:2-polyprenyl-3-methyl-5-hydroxy-6-metoxy-1,4-benzoquinol methylase
VPLAGCGMTTLQQTVELRALQTRGESSDVIHQAVAQALRDRGLSGAVIDAGCGTGQFSERLSGIATSYTGVDVIGHRGFPQDARFVRADLDRGAIPLPDESADIVVAIEIIEHLENPRAFCREIVRLLKPSGWMVISTPNQLSALSLLTLLIRGQFAAFQENSYPAHRTALLEIDLRRIASECRLTDLDVRYTCSGRIPTTGVHYPPSVARLFPRACSDNLLLVARKHG